VALRPPPGTIIHVDMDASTASVEQRDRPEIRGRPVIVASDPPGGGSRPLPYEARGFGVPPPCRSAAPFASARRASSARGHGKYAAVSREIMGILAASPPAGARVIDRLLDVTAESLASRRRARQSPADQGDDQGAGDLRLRRRRFEYVRGKVASDLEKPDGPRGGPVRQEAESSGRSPSPVSGGMGK